MPSLRRRLVPTTGPKCDYMCRRLLRRSLEFACSALLSCQQQINKYHNPCADGLAEIAGSILSDLQADGLDCRHPAAVLYTLGLAVDEGALPGKLGAGLTVLFLRWAEHLERCEVLDWRTWSGGVELGLRSLEETGWKDDVLVYGLGPVIRGFANDVREGRDWVSALERAAVAAEAGAVSTAEFYGGVADATCHALGVVVRAIYQAVQLEIASRAPPGISHSKVSQTDNRVTFLDLNDPASTCPALIDPASKDNEISDYVSRSSEISDPVSKYSEMNDSVLRYSGIRDSLSNFPALGEPVLKRPALMDYVSGELNDPNTLVFPTPRKPLSFYS